MSGERDPRAWWLDDDPFDKKRHNENRNNSKPNFGQQNQKNPFQDILNEYFSNNSGRTSSVHKGSIWHFSKIEIQHLFQATLAFTLALAFMGSGRIFGALANPSSFVYFGILYFISLTPAFLLHEIAHKIMARRYGCWAEFRANPSGLRFGVILAALTGIVFMAPGAVMVAGKTSKDQFGRIALAGPVSNIILWNIGIIVAYIFGGNNTIFDQVTQTWLWGNAILAAFNMLPFGPLDGRKIKTWSDTIFNIWFSITLATVWITYKYSSMLFI